MSTLPLSPDELLTTTRSVRKRLDLYPAGADGADPGVPGDRAAGPQSGSNAQSWHWIVVTDPEQRSAIGEVYRRRSGPTRTPAAPPGAVRRRPGPRRRRSCGSARAPPSSASAWATCRCWSSPAAASASCPPATRPDVWGSLLPGRVELHARRPRPRAGTAWTTLHLDYEAEVAELLGLPDDVRQGVLIPTAFYTGDTFRPAPARTPRRGPAPRPLVTGLRVRVGGGGRRSRGRRGDTRRGPGRPPASTAAPARRRARRGSPAAAGPGPSGGSRSPAPR